MNKRIAVLTSGGDAPGMNAAIRSVTRTARDQEMDVIGIQKGFEGLMNGNIRPLTARAVGGILEKSGTFLASSRTERFKTEQGQNEAINTIEENDIDGLVIIGGNGSQKGALALQQKGISTIGIAASIDNDIYGADFAIGVNSAMEVAVEAIDQLRATMSSLHRCSLVQVMGRNHGFLAQQTGIAGGAESIVIPEVQTNPKALARQIQKANQRDKRHALIVVAEGAQYNAEELKRKLENYDGDLGFEIRTTILGHIQRGRTPTAYDRIIASRLGFLAARTLARNTSGKVACWKKGEPSLESLETVASRKKELDLELMNESGVLAQ